MSAIALYSTSVEDKETILCPFVHQEMKHYQKKKTQCPVVEQRIMGQPAQSKSQKATEFSLLSDPCEVVLVHA